MRHEGDAGQVGDDVGLDFGDHVGHGRAVAQVDGDEAGTARFARQDGAEHAVAGRAQFLRQVAASEAAYARDERALAGALAVEG